MITTRFAPSPTGFLHVGGVRTALFSWLYAKKNNGKFILRIEDTDLERSTQEAVDAIFDGMNWLGLKSDVETYYQTNRFDRYKEVIDQLISDGKAYYCSCSKIRIDALRASQKSNNINIGYDNKCRYKNYVPKDGDNFVIRFKTPKSGIVSWNDIVKGKISISNETLDDIIIQRADGTPTYNFCVVVDDIDMAITHVIRGDDHVNNTPKQIHFYKALNTNIPVFAHLPMILGSDGAKLSKRHNASNIMSYREDGYLPQAMLNYLVRLGWSYGNQEIFSLEEMINSFNLEHISASPSRFNYNKLKWLNKQYMKESKFKNIFPEVEYHFLKLGLNINNGPNLQDLVPVMAKKIDTLVDLTVKSIYFYDNDIKYDERAVKKYFKKTTANILLIALKKFESLSSKEWQNAYVLSHIIENTAEQCGVAMRKVGMPIRVAITGCDESPDIGITLKLLGKEKVITRISNTIDNINNSYNILDKNKS